MLLDKLGRTREVVEQILEFGVTVAEVRVPFATGRHRLTFAQLHPVANFALAAVDQLYKVCRSQTESFRTSTEKIQACVEQEICRNTALEFLDDLGLFLTTSSVISTLRQKKLCRRPLADMLFLITKISDQICLNKGKNASKYHGLINAESSFSFRCLAILTPRNKFKETTNTYAMQFEKAKKWFDRYVQHELSQIALHHG